MFETDKAYKRKELHRKYGGQEQGGISTPANHPMVLLFFGERGEEHGYKDGWSTDGFFYYTGEGQRGDMEFVRGKAAIRDHATNGKDIYLFESVGKGYVRHVGQMMCTGFQLRQMRDTKGWERKAIVFQLKPLHPLQT